MYTRPAKLHTDIFTIKELLQEYFKHPVTVYYELAELIRKACVRTLNFFPDQTIWLKKLNSKDEVKEYAGKLPDAEFDIRCQSEAGEADGGSRD